MGSSVSSFPRVSYGTERWEDFIFLDGLLSHGVEGGVPFGFQWYSVKEGILYQTIGDLVFCCMNEENVGKIKKLDSSGIGYVSGIKGVFRGMILNAGLSYWHLKILKFINWEVEEGLHLKKSRCLGSE